MEAHILNTRYGIDIKNLPYLVEDAKDYAFYKGLGMRAKDLILDVRMFVPFCLLPSPFPEKWFNLVKEIQPYLNFILHKIAHSKELLQEALASTIEVDEFTRNTFKIFEAVEHDQQLTLGMIRSDYLLNVNSSDLITGIKQIEMNTISAGFGGLAPEIRDLHEFVLDRLGQKDFEHKLPVNESVFLLAKGIVAAWDTYDNSNAAILFVVEDVTYNICDQRALEYAILDYEKKIKILRCPFKELRKCAVLKEKTLFVKDKEIAVVYYRVGYVPEQYELEDWEVRLLMERSRAIKCPSAGLHLAGTKRVQVYLKQPGILEKFVDEDIAKKIRTVFVELYSLDKGPDGDEAVSKAILNPEKFVLKPEREGGGYNLYDDEIKTLLENIKNSDKRNAYILMERINPPLIPNCIIRKGKIPQAENVICELGIFGTILGNNEEIYMNNTAGHVLRSKETTFNECGIAAGFGSIDSPYFE